MGRSARDGGLTGRVSWFDSSLVLDNRPVVGILYRLFKVGRMPSYVRSEIAGERVIHQVEGIRVSLHRSGRVPGSVVASGVNVGWGSFAVTDKRVIGSRGRVKWVDVPYEMAAGGPATFTFDTKGMHVAFDLDEVHPSTSGSMRIDFHDELSDSDLLRLPMREGSFPVDPQKVVRLFGSLKKLPADPNQ